MLAHALIHLPHTLCGMVTSNRAHSRDHYRQRALARRRDPEQGARNAARIDAIRGRMDALLAGLPQIEALNARAGPQPPAP